MEWFERKRTPPEAVLYGLYLYALGLSFRGVSAALEPFVKRSHVGIWGWAQRFRPLSIFRIRRVTAFLVDETYVKVGSFEAWIGVAVEPIHHLVLGVYLSRHQNMLVAEAFLRSLVKRYGQHLVYSDGGSWYPEAWRAWGRGHRLHTPYEKSLMERAMQYVKDRTEGFDDYYPCRKGIECKLGHVSNWLGLFTQMLNARRMGIRFTQILSFIGGELTLT
jgi:putative transposase